MPIDTSADTTSNTPPPRDPDDFKRLPSMAPQVTHPTATTKRAGNKAELIQQAEDEGWGDEIESHKASGGKVTVEWLHKLLGPRPTWVTHARSSSYGKDIESSELLSKWRERAVTVGIHLQPSILNPLDQLGDVSLNDGTQRSTIQHVADTAKDVAKAGAAAERGTHMHTVTEYDDTERSIVDLIEHGDSQLQLPESVQRAVLECWRQLTDGVIEMVATETKVTSDHYGASGTVDRVGRMLVDWQWLAADDTWRIIPAGTVLVVDIKTGQLRVTSGHPDYWHSNAVQAVVYADSTPYNTRRDEREPWAVTERPSREVALIAHLDVHGALETGVATGRLIPVDLLAAREGAEIARRAREWNRRRDVFGVVDAVPPVVIHVESAAPSHPSQASTPSTSVDDGDVEQPDQPTPDASPSASQASAGHTLAVGALQHRMLLLDDQTVQDIVDGWDVSWGPLNILSTPALVSPTTLAAITGLVDRCDPFASVTASNPEPRRGLVDQPDEGDTMTTADVGLIADQWAQLTGDDQRWVERVTQQATGGRSLLVSASNLETITQRRWHAWQAIIRLADVGVDDAVRGAIAYVWDDRAYDTTWPVGELLGSLHAEQARQLHDLADAIRRGDAALRVDRDGNYRWSMPEDPGGLAELVHEDDHDQLPNLLNQPSPSTKG